MTGRRGAPGERTTVNDQNPHDGTEPDREPDASVTLPGETPTAPDGRSGEAGGTDGSPHAAQSATDRPVDASTTDDPRQGAPTGAPFSGSTGAGVDGIGAHSTATPHAAAAADRAPDGGAPSYGVGPFSVREIALLGAWVVAFFVSFFRTNILDSPSGVLVGGGNVWLSGLWWIPAVALPTVAVGLIVLRRLSPQGIRRVGSLGIDQFASVAFTVSALVWVSWVWDTVAVFTETGIWTRSWVIWVEAVVLLAGVVLTVFAPIVPPFSSDFRDREEVPAHRSARPIRPVVPRPRAPRAPRPAADAAGAHAGDAPAPGSYTGSTDLAHDGVAHHAIAHDGTSRAGVSNRDTAHADGAREPHEAAPPTTVLPAQHGDEHDTDIFAPLRETGAHERVSPDGRAEHERQTHDGQTHDGHLHDGQDAAGHAGRDHAHAQAFWALAPEEREVVDDYGTPIFRVGPTAWALVIEDRGETFVVRHDDGRIGYLHDVSGVTRG